MTRAQLDLDRQLASVPLRNAHVRAEPAEPGEVPVLEVELRYAGWMAPIRRLMRLRSKRRIRLDPTGWSVYQAIDGKKTFEKLVDAFALEHKLDFLESRALLMAHIRNLMWAGLVVVGVKGNREKSA